MVLKWYVLIFFSTGHLYNIKHLLDDYPTRFTLIEGDIRDIKICIRATQGIDSVLHEAALGSVSRSIDDPIATNDVNICEYKWFSQYACSCKRLQGKTIYFCIQ